MAAVGSAGGRDRGQLVLVGGVALATVFVAMTLVLNAGIYTHNFASRSDTRLDGAASVEGSVERGVGRLLSNAVASEPDAPGRQADIMSAGVADIGARFGRRGSREGVFIDVTRPRTTEGTRIVQQAGRNLTNASGAADWTLVADSDGLRAFRLNVSRTSLVAGSGGVPSGAFHVLLADDAGNRWAVYLSRENGSTEVHTENLVTGTTYGPCRDDTGARTVVDLTDGEVAGARCPALEFFERLPGALDGTAAIDVSFADTVAGDSPTATGAYQLTVARDESAVDDGDFHDDGSGASPQARATLYSVRVDLAYVTRGLAYRTVVTAAPGGPDA